MERATPESPGYSTGTEKQAVAFPCVTLTFLYAITKYLNSRYSQPNNRPIILEQPVRLLQIT